jgi:acetylornithine/succinyldiaminopimelate/putrescine aminotransferase
VTEDWFAESIVDVIEFEGPARAGICDQYDVLLISDEVICAWGRLGEWFGSERYD